MFQPAARTRVNELAVLGMLRMLQCLLTALSSACVASINSCARSIGTSGKMSSTALYTACFPVRGSSSPKRVVNRLATFFTVSAVIVFSTAAAGDRTTAMYRESFLRAAGTKGHTGPRLPR